MLQMKKKLVKFVVLCMILNMLFLLTAYAEELKWEDFYGEDTECVLTPEGTVVSRDEKAFQKKNEVLSTAISQITNEGKGKLSILLNTMAHVDVDKIQQEALLDRWDSEHGTWVNVARYMFMETADQHPEGGFSYLISSKTIEGQPVGYYYRVRGVHAVFYNGKTDGFSTRTDGVLLTNP